MKHNSDIAQRLTAYFFFAILIFALVISAAFSSLFGNSIIDNSREDLKNQTVAFAGSLGEYFARPDQASLISFNAYLKVLNDTNNADIWIIDDTLQIYHTGKNAIEYKQLPKSANEMVSKAFSGQTVTSNGFTAVLQTPSISVATPIYRGDYIIGVMLAHSPISGVQQMASDSMKIFMLCVCGSVLLSIIPARYFSKRFTDPIKLKEANEKLKLEQMRRDYVANISHELKTPVTVLRGSLEALVDGIVTDEADVREYHEQMLNETVYLQRLVLDLLDLSRLQNSGFEMEHSELSLTQVIDDAVKSGEKLAQDKGITINKNYIAPKDSFTGDYGRLRQMFIIILDNAVKFSHEGGAIDVIFAGKIVRIKDYGVGIEPDKLPYIFERFYKSTGENNKQGSGLGLAIAKEIAYRHDIKISAKSKPNEGTEFIFEFK